jgi:hypothetical protein
MAHTYRTFKQILKLAKTRRLRGGKKRRAHQRKQTRKHSRGFLFSSKRGGAGTPFSADATVVAPVPDPNPKIADPDRLPTPMGVATYNSEIKNQGGV